MNILEHIRTVPDFPKEGINFYDISTLLADAQAWKFTVDALADMIEPYKPDMILGIESRGFLVAAPLAYKMGIGFGMIRKKGKLPGKTIEHSYDLEYGQDTVEVQPDLIPNGATIVLVDDLLATGGTMAAAHILVENAGAKVSAGICIIELDGLGGRDKLDFPFKAFLNAPA